MEETRINGVRIYYELHGQGEPLVCLHGLQGDSSHFRGLVPAFSRTYRTLTFDQRGSGLSDKPAMDYTTALLADDAATLMDAVDFDSAHVFRPRRPGRPCSPSSPVSARRETEDA